MKAMEFLIFILIFRANGHLGYNVYVNDIGICLCMDAILTDISIEQTDGIKT